MPPTKRKPKVGIQRPQEKQAGMPKAKHKVKPNITYLDALHGDKKQAPEDQRSPHKPENVNDEGWKLATTKVPEKHLTRSDTAKKEIDRIMPKLTEIIRRNEQANTDKIHPTQFAKFRELQTQIATHRNKPVHQRKLQDTYYKLKMIANSIGYSELSDPQGLASLTRTRKEKSHKPTVGTDEDIIMPELEYGDPETEYDNYSSSEDEKEADEAPALLARTSESDDDSSTTTFGARFVIGLERTQNSIDDHPEVHDMMNRNVLTQLDSSDDEAYKDKDQNDIPEIRNLARDMKEAGLRIEKEIEEISNIPDSIQLHTPHVKGTDTPNAPYAEYDLEGLVAQAISKQMDEKQKEMETAWDKKRKESEHEHKETLEAQTSVQMSIVTHETDKMRKELEILTKSIITARGALNSIHEDIHLLKTTYEHRHQELEQLQVTLAEVQESKLELKQEKESLRDMIQEARQMKLDLATETRTTARATIQTVVDTQTARAEKAIIQTMKKRTQTIVTDAKKGMTIELADKLARELKAKRRTLNDEITTVTDDAFNTAASLLDQAVMQIGNEMESAVTEFRNTLAEPHEKARFMDRIQQRTLRDLKPKVADIQDDIIKEVTREIERTVKSAQEDMFIYQGKMLHEAEEKIHAHNHLMALNVEAMKKDMRKEAEDLEAELQEHANQHMNGQAPSPTTTPQTTPPQTQPDMPTPADTAAPRMSNPYTNRTNPVSPSLRNEVTIPSEEVWHQMVSKAKEKITITYPLPHDAQGLDEAQAEGFYRHLRENCQGYPAIRIRYYDDLTRRGNTIPVEYETGWPPQYVKESSSILFEKLNEAIPTSMVNVRQVLGQYLRNRDGYQALMTIMKRSTPRLGQLPPKMEPLWDKNMTPTEYANLLQTYCKQQEKLGRYYSEFEIIATMAQRAMEQPEYFNVGSTRAQHLIAQASHVENFQDIVMSREDSPHSFATTLETYSQSNQQHHINMMSDNSFPPSINKFERNNTRHGNGNRPPRGGDGDKDRKPRELCPCCLRMGHNVEKGSVCWMGAQVENVLKYNKENPEKAKENMANFKRALNPTTITKMQIRFPEEFQGLEPDSMEMMEAAVSVFELFHKTDDE
jgi:hypothetical protein